MKEKIHFAENVPISITVGNYLEHPIHFHDELEIVYVLEGSINMRNGHYSYRLKEGDVYFFNEREMHSFEAVGEEKNLVMVLHLDFNYYNKYYENRLENNFFVSGVDSEDMEEEQLEMLRTIISNIMLEKIQKGYDYEHRIIEKGHNLISLMLSDFQNFLLEDGKFVNNRGKKENKILSERLARITAYMYENYDRKLTLNEIAEREHLSLFYLSHVIKESTGLSFQGLLNFIRVEESEKFLLGTNKKMGTIAEECGFSALRYFVKHFEQWFGMPPAEYREKYSGKTSNRKSRAIMEMATVAEIEEAIKPYVNSSYGLDKENKPLESVWLEITGKESPLGEEKEIPLIANFEKGRNLSLYKPFQMFKVIGEKIIAAGENYVVSKNIGKNGKASYSFLISYGNVGLIKKFMESKSYGEAEAIIRNEMYNKEFLIKFKELNGNLELVKYRITERSILENMKQIKDDKSYENGRERLLAAMKEYPKVTYEKLPANENLLVRSVLSSMEVELILVDEV